MTTDSERCAEVISFFAVAVSLLNGTGDIPVSPSW